VLTKYSKMKRGIFVLLIMFSIAIIVLLGAFAFAEDKFSVSVNLVEPELKFDVLNSIDLGNITKGYALEADSTQKIFINNTGDVDIKFSAEFVESFEDSDAIKELRKYFYLSDTTTDSSFDLVEDFSTIIDKPTTYGSSNTDYIYSKVNLKNFTGDYNSLIGEHIVKIRLIAMEA
jgi:hypothetical protein